MIGSNPAEFVIHDKTGYPLSLDTLVEVSNMEGTNKFRGRLCFEAGAFGIGSLDYIPNEFKRCGNDNFVSLWELYNTLGVEEFTDIEEYITIIFENGDLMNECSTCPFTSKCENQGKCK